LSTSAFITLPALNFTTLRAGITTVLLGLFGLRPMRGFAGSDFEHAKIAELDGVAADEAFGDVVERALHHVKDLVLCESRFVGDANDQLSLRHGFSSPSTMDLMCARVWSTGIMFLSVCERSLISTLPSAIDRR